MIRKAKTDSSNKDNQIIKISIMVVIKVSIKFIFYSVKFLKNNFLRLNEMVVFKTYKSFLNSL